MNNYYIPAVEKALLKDKLRDPVRADVPYQTIAPDDIGQFAALAFARPQHFTGLALEIAGSELTNWQAADVFGRVLGRPVRFRRIPMTVVRIALSTEFYQMYRWFNAGGFQADIAGLRRDYPEIHLTSPEEWLPSARDATDGDLRKTAENCRQPAPEGPASFLTGWFFHQERRVQVARQLMAKRPAKGLSVPSRAASNS